MKDFKKLNQEEKVLFRVVKSLFHDLWTHEINPEEAMEEIAEFILPIERLEQLTNKAHYNKPYVPSPNRSATLQEQLDAYLKQQKEYEESGKKEADRIQWKKEREERERLELKQMRIEEETRQRIKDKIEHSKNKN